MIIVKCEFIIALSYAITMRMLTNDQLDHRSFATKPCQSVDLSLRIFKIFHLKHKAEHELNLR